MVEPSCPQSLFTALLKRLVEGHNGVMGRTRIVLLRYGSKHLMYHKYQDHSFFTIADWHSIVSIQKCVFNAPGPRGLWMVLDGYVQGQVQSEVNTPVRNAVQGIAHSVAPSMASLIDGYFQSKCSEEVKVLFLCDETSTFEEPIPESIVRVMKEEDLPKDLFPSPEKKPGAFNLLRAIVSTTQQST